MLRRRNGVEFLKLDSGTESPKNLFPSTTCPLLVEHHLTMVFHVLAMCQALFLALGRHGEQDRVSAFMKVIFEWEETDNKQ